MRAKFARTLREHMRDAEKYTHPGLHVWTAEDSEIADLLLRVIKQSCLNWSATLFWQRPQI